MKPEHNNSFLGKFHVRRGFIVIIQKKCGMGDVAHESVLLKLNQITCCDVSLRSETETAL